MAAPSYTTDLATLHLSEVVTGWAEPTATGWTLGAAPGTADSENFIQGTLAVPKAFNATGVGGMLLDFGSSPTIPTDGVFTGWVFFSSPANIDTAANGGIRFIAGSALNNFKAWILGGSDTYLYGGWINCAVDPTIAADYTETGTGTNRYFGWVVKTLSSITKGSPFVTDAFRYGRAEARINGGETANYATFAGYAAQNDNVSNRWGLIQAIPGGYLWKGLMTLGYTSAIDMRDSDTTILIDNTKKVGANFNLIEIRQSSSRVDWTNIIFKALGTVSRGRFAVIDNADVNIQLCQFVDMDTFVLLGATAILNSTFKNCNTITAPGSNLTGSSVLTPIVAADTSAVVWNVATDPDGLLDNMTFTKGTNAHHSIELGTSSPTTVTLRGITFTGFNASNSQNDSVIHVKRTTGTVTINAVGCAGTVSYKSAGATVVLVQDPVTTTVTVVDINTGSPVESARIIVTASDNTGPMPFDETVTITSTGTTATVAHTAHGLIDGKQVQIKGANEQAYNGIFTVTVTGANEYTYTMGSDPVDTATGTIKATGVVIHGVTNASGIISDTRTHASSQPIVGRVRKATGGTIYKTGSIAGTISNSTGFSTTIQLIQDT